ncbi:MAG: TonB-dependent receptor domain-containing protein [Acidimicrobiia bacterium]
MTTGLLFPMNPTPRYASTRIFKIVRMLGALSAGSLATLLAQAPATGLLTGRVFNPATREYVQNAEVRLEGTALATTTGFDGSYRLENVPAGQVTVVVSYSGYTNARVVVQVPAAGRAVRDVELARTGPGGERRDGAVVMDTFSVSAEREGNAKAIMQQRQSMNVTNNIASDSFGDFAEGNVGEFLKNIPGIDIEENNGEIIRVRLRGMQPEYASVTLDGVRLASADANVRTGGRAFSFEQISLGSIDMIEVNKTTSADVDANAPAGSINLRTKRAFSRGGRRVSAQANVTAFDDDFSTGKTAGPGDARHRKLRPGASVEYSDVFLNQRLGFVLSVTEGNRCTSTERVWTGYSPLAQVPSPRNQSPLVPFFIQLDHWPKLVRQFSTTLTGDFKATSNLTLSLSLIFSGSENYSPTRSLRFGTGAETVAGRDLVTGDAQLTGLTTGPNGLLTVGTNLLDKWGEGLTVLPSFEYRRGPVTVEGKFALSDALSWYRPLSAHRAVTAVQNLRHTGFVFTARRSSPVEGDWQIVQQPGRDASSGASFQNTTITVDDSRAQRTAFHVADLAATMKSTLGVPVVWKAGAKVQRETKHVIRDFNSAAMSRFTYVGPGSGPTGSLAAFNSPTSAVRATPAGASVTLSPGGSVFMPDLHAIGGAFRGQPGYFQQQMTATDYYNAQIVDPRFLQEEVAASFLMGTATVGRATYRAGLRWERTSTDSDELNPRTAEEVRRAGYPVDDGRALTIPGLEYQFNSRPRTHRRGSYDNFFPSASWKYRVTDSLHAQLGYSSTIKRPNISTLSGVWQVNDETMRVIAPNPNLKPERAQNLSAFVAYYFEPVGSLSVHAYESRIKNLHRSGEATAEQFGYRGTEYAGYSFVTSVASQEEVKLRGLEFEYSQSLSFLPKPFNGLGVRAGYTRIYASRYVPQMVPHGSNAGLNFAARRVNVFANWLWRDNVRTSNYGLTFTRHRASVDLGGSLQLSKKLSLFFNGRNLTSSPTEMRQIFGALPAVSTQYMLTPTLWTFGLKAVY